MKLEVLEKTTLLLKSYFSNSKWRYGSKQGSHLRKENPIVLYVCIYPFRQKNLLEVKNYTFFKCKNPTTLPSQ